MRYLKIETATSAHLAPRDLSPPRNAPVPLGAPDALDGNRAMPDGSPTAQKNAHFMGVSLRLMAIYHAATTALAVVCLLRF